MTFKKNIYQKTKDIFSITTITLFFCALSQRGQAQYYYPQQQMMNSGYQQQYQTTPTTVNRGYYPTQQQQMYYPQTQTNPKIYQQQQQMIMNQQNQPVQQTERSSLFTVPSPTSSVYAKIAYHMPSYSGDGFTSSECDTYPGNCDKPKELGGSAKAFGLGFGVHITPHIRGELAYASYTGLNYADKISWSITTPTAEIAQSITGGEIQSSVIMVGVYYDSFSINLGNFELIPFITGGIGFAYNNISDTKITTDLPADYIYLENTTKNTAWKMGAGLTIEVSDLVQLEFSYTMENLGSIETSKNIALQEGDPAFITNPHTADLTFNTITGALRFSF